MKKIMLTVLASLVLAVPVSLVPALPTIADPMPISSQENQKLSKYMRTVYKTTEHPELDEYVFKAFQTIEDNKYSKYPIIVYTGDYESCRVFREYFNYSYGFTYDFRLQAYRTDKSADFVVALNDTSNLDVKISNYLAEVEKAKSIAQGLNADDTNTTAYNIFHWVRANLRYDYSLHGNATENEMLNSYYGFYNGTPTICKGFSMAVYQLCSMNGIPATMETGMFFGTGHAWNTVLVNGNLKYVDVLNEQSMVNDQLPAGYIKQ